jgi:hypothetical protein
LIVLREDEGMSGYSGATTTGDHREAGARARGGARSTARTIHAGLAVLFPIGLVVQVFLAGLGVFEGPQAFATHRDMGYTLSLVAILLVVVGLIGGVPRRLTGLAALIFVLFMVQSILVAVRADAPWIAALHPVNGFLITILAVVLARDAWLGRRATLGAAQ